MTNHSVRLAIIAETLGQADCSDLAEIGQAVDDACAGIREIVAELASGEQAELAAEMAGPLVAPDPGCYAVVRRNTVDGQLYPCGFPETDAVHVSIEACAVMRGRPCDQPSEHHAFVAEPVAVAS